MKNCKLITFILFLAGTLQGSAQQAENVFGGADSIYDEAVYQAHVKPDTVLIKNTRLVPHDSILSLKHQKRFAYVSLMDSLLKQQAHQLRPDTKRRVSMVERIIDSTFFRFFIWLVPLSLVVVVLYNLVKSRAIFSKEKDSNVYKAEDEDLPGLEQDYARLVKKAEGRNDFRKAVKYLFLQTLQQLSAAGFISYAMDKTNYQYLQEISMDKRQAFARLALNYEYTWYGNTVPDKLMYTKIEKEFVDFFQKYNLS